MTMLGAGRRRVLPLAVGGALGFWLANFLISLTPLAADYRAALSIAYLPMLLQALIGGLIIGTCVSYCLLRFFDKIPGNSAMTKSLELSFVAFALVTLFLETPAKLQTPLIDSIHYLLIATLFNGIRILALGAVIGHLYSRLDERMPS
jgi:hypothetical protein